MKILVAGKYDFWMYRRGEILVDGLKENKIRVIECITPENEFYLRLIGLIIRDGFDAILVNGVAPLILVWLLKIFHRKKIIYDVFISRYNTEVEDKQKVPKSSVRAYFLKLTDKITCSLADICFLDTKAHIGYFKALGIDTKKFSVVYVGANDRHWKKANHVKSKKRFNIVFWGSFSRLHGTDCIVRAANILRRRKDIRFHMLGFSKSQKYGLKFWESEALAKRLGLDNILFTTGKTVESGLAEYVSSCDACLGIFGDTVKARMVIPHKVFEAMALEKPVISMDCGAMREVFSDRVHCLLVPPDDPERLAEAIINLKEDSLLRNRIAENAYALYRKRFDNRAIGRQLIMVIEKATGGIR